MRKREKRREKRERARSIFREKNANYKKPPIFNIFVLFLSSSTFLK
jgi:hypothetical protein